MNCRRKIRIKSLSCIAPGKLGLRSAYIEGFQKAFEMGADAVVQMDADFSHDPAVLTEMARRIASCDVVIGSRYVKGGSLDERWPAWRKAAFRLWKFLCPDDLEFPLRDVTTGYRMWRREALQNMPLDRHPVQWVYLSGRNGVCCVPDGI